MLAGEALIKAPLPSQNDLLCPLLACLAAWLGLGDIGLAWLGLAWLACLLASRGDQYDSVVSIFVIDCKDPGREPIA